MTFDDDHRLTCKQLIINTANALGALITVGVIISPIVFGLIAYQDNRAMLMLCVLYPLFLFAYVALNTLCLNVCAQPMHQTTNLQWNIIYAASFIGFSAFYTAMFLSHYGYITEQQTLIIVFIPIVPQAIYFTFTTAIPCIIQSVPTTWDEPTQPNTQNQSAGTMSTRRIIQIPEANHTIIVIAEPLNTETAIINNMKEARVEII